MATFTPSIPNSLKPELLLNSAIQQWNEAAETAEEGISSLHGDLLPMVLEKISHPLDLFPLRCVNRQWCAFATDFIWFKATADVSVQETQTFLLLILSQLNENDHKEQIEKIISLYSNLSPQSKKLFAPRWYEDVVQSLQQVTLEIQKKDYLNKTCIAASIRDLSSSHSTFGKIYALFCNATPDLRANSMNKDGFKQFVESPVLQLTELKCFSLAHEAFFINRNKYHTERNVTNEFSLFYIDFSYQQALRGDIQRICMSLLGHYCSNDRKIIGSASQTMKNIYRELIDRDLSKTAIHLCMTYAHTQKYPVSTVLRLLGVLCERGQDKAANKVLQNYEKKYPIETNPNAIFQLRRTIVNGCLSYNEPPEEYLKLAIELAQKIGESPWTTEYVEELNKKLETLREKGAESKDSTS